MVSLAAGLIMLVGSYGAPEDVNFRTYSFDIETGQALPLDSLSGLSNPSFLAFADNGETVLAVNEDNNYSASLSMLRKKDGRDGHYEQVAQRSVIGKDPCHVAVSPDGKYAVTANYSSGTISVLPFNGEAHEIEKPRLLKFTGNGPDSVRQDMSHPHFTTFTPDGRFMVVTDLGTDRLHLFPLNDDGYPELSNMMDVNLTPGYGPRHIAFDHKGENAYMINELSGYVSHFRYTTFHDTLLPVNAYLADYENGGGGADIHISPDGQHVYVSNRLKGDGIAIFSVDTSNGWELVPVGYQPTGIHPRNFNITPDGNWVVVACRDDNRIEVYRRNHKDGTLSPTGYSISCPRPVCIVFE